MNEQEKNPSQAAGQQDITPETDERNRENETGQQGQAASGQAQQPETGEAQQEQGDTTLASKTEQTSQQGQSESTPPSPGFVGSSDDKSSDYLTKGEEDQDFAAKGQGAADIETGQARNEDSNLDEGSSE